MRKLVSWIVLGIGIVLIIGSILISRTNVSTAALATGDYEIVLIRLAKEKVGAFLLDKSTGTTWWFRTDPKTHEMYWLKVKAKPD